MKETDTSEGRRRRKEGFRNAAIAITKQTTISFSSEICHKHRYHFFLLCLTSSTELAFYVPFISPSFGYRPFCRKCVAEDAANHEKMRPHFRFPMQKPLYFPSLPLSFRKPISGHVPEREKEGEAPFCIKALFSRSSQHKTRPAAVRVCPSIFSPPSDQHENRTFLPKRGVGGSSSSSL